MSIAPYPPVNLSNKRILVVPLRFVGDAVVTLPLLQLMKAKYPACHLSVWCSAIGETLFNASSSVDACVREPKSLFQRMNALKSGDYDAVIVLRKSLTMALLCYWAGIPVRCGYDMQRFPAPVGFHRTGWGLTHVVPYPQFDTKHHQAWHHARHLAILSGQESLALPHPQLNLSQQDAQTASQLLDLKQEKLVVVHGLSASKSKQMDLSVFTPVIRTLTQQGFNVVVTGTAADEESLSDWVCREHLSVVNLAGKTTLLQLLALLRQACLLVSLDSGPVHLAGVAGTSVVALYGHTNPQQWGPLSDGGNLTQGFVPVSYQADELSDIVAERLQQAVIKHPVVQEQLKVSSG